MTSPALPHAASGTATDIPDLFSDSALPSLAESFAYCKALTRREARNFYYGLCLTPEPRRSAMYAVYAWMRAADDLADSPETEEDLPHNTQGAERFIPEPPAPSQGGAGGGSSKQAARTWKMQQLDAFQQVTHRALGAAADDGQAMPVIPDIHKAMWPAVCRTFADYPIQQADLDAMIHGQLADQTKTTYQNFDELYRYCYNVASVVGMVCISVWGYRGGDATRTLAEKRGIAFQLTNILRDLVEDAQRGRVYLPADELAQFGCTAEQLTRRQADDNFDKLMRFQIQRARDYYQQADTLEQQLEPDCRAASSALNRIYRGLLEQIAANPRAVLTRRVRLNNLRKLGIAVGATMRARWAR